MTDAGIPMGEGQQVRALLQAAWDNCPTVPDIIFTPKEAEQILAGLAFAGTPPPAAAGDREALVRQCAEIANEAYRSYSAPTDWDYGAQDACTKIERAILALRTPDPNSGGEASDG